MTLLVNIFSCIDMQIILSSRTGQPGKASSLHPVQTAAVVLESWVGRRGGQCLGKFASRTLWQLR